MADKSGKPIKGKAVKFVRQGEMVYMRLTVPRAICVETFKDFEQFGRFMLRDEGTKPARVRAAHLAPITAWPRRSR